MSRVCHPSYQRLAELAEARHAQGRNHLGLSAGDIARARLYSHAYRGHVIGAFSATRRALADLSSGCPAGSHRVRALELLADLADLAMDPIPPDHRALLGSFYRYEQGIRRVLEAMARDQETQPDDRTARIVDRFRAVMDQVSGSNGIVLTRDTLAPEQASFVVPSLGITIVPLVYGDYHSWNLAYLPGRSSDVPCHRHHEAVEIHLGYSPLHGETILGDCRAEVREGYAMPIPPGTVHGYVNRGEQEHHVPFVYGSLKAGGWGVFLDVEAQPRTAAQLRLVPRDDPALNGTAWLERDLDQAEAETRAHRRVIIPAAATQRDGCGGLELAVTRITADDFHWPIDGYRIVSVVRGEGELHLAGAEQAVGPHDHFGIPAGLAARLRQRGNRPLVVLDALLSRDR
jgi:hypothetical protein